MKSIFRFFGLWTNREHKEAIDAIAHQLAEEEKRARAIERDLVSQRIAYRLLAEDFEKMRRKRDARGRFIRN